MPAIRTFVDADVLIWAARGREPLSDAAMAVLTGPNREFVASDFLRLEVIPKAAYNKQAAEDAFYQRFFDAVEHWCDVSPPLITVAHQTAIRYGLSAIDAIHVAAAQTMAADELVTAERTTSPLFRVQEVRIVSIRPLTG
jgi:predicted nucleic acid-binding protein